MPILGSHGLSVRHSRIKQVGTGWCVCLAALAVAVWVLVLVTDAQATDFTWTGAAPELEPKWSNAANWGGTVPSGTVGTLTFPPLIGCELGTTCSSNFDDIAGLTASSLVVAGGYGIGGDPSEENLRLELGSGGITVSGPQSTALEVPITLASPQTWQISGSEGGGLALFSTVQGEGVPLHVSLQAGGFLTIMSGGESARGGLAVGSTLVTGTGTLTLDQTFVSGPVELQGVSADIVGANIFGSLTSKASVVNVEGTCSGCFGEGIYQDGLGVKNLMLDPSSTLALAFLPGGRETHVHAFGDVSLAGASLVLHCDQCGSSAPECPELSVGSEDDLVTADGTLNGEFAGLPNGGTVSITGCTGPHPPPTFRITYTPHAVIATVVGVTSPSVTTTPASSVSGTSATLHGTVTPNGSLVTECYFEYGETSGVYGSTVPCAQTVGAGASPVSVSATLSALTPGTTYHVRLVAVSSGHGAVYGSDQSFTTAGATLPTVQTGYAYGGWPSSATLTGVINPHGNSVTYEFRYGTAPVAVSSYSDILTGYWGHVAGSGALSGTTSQEVSANIDGLAGDTPYYVRLVAFYDGLVTWGPEVSFEITPPEPRATEAPYLQVNGTDAATGYRVRCQPGNWSYTNYNFKTQWVYVARNGSASPARSGVGSGNEYQVDQSDIGHPLACLVTPYKLDGHLPTGPGNTTLQSDVLLPEGTGLLVIPSWLKTAWSVISTAHDVPSAWDAGVLCGAAVLLPELFAEDCLVDATRFALANALGDAFGSAVDPPEANYQGIALPQPLATPRRDGRQCPKSLKSGPCRALIRLARAYATASGRATAVIEAIAISRNRTLIAQKKGDSDTLVVQGAARKVYFGMLAGAMEEQRKSGAVYAAALRRLHLDFRISATRIKKALLGHRLASWERSLRRRMLTHGFDKASVRKAFAMRPKSVHSFDFVRTLATASPPAAFGRYYDEINLNDLMALVSGLAAQHALLTSTAPQLFSDLDKVRAACTQAARSAAMQRFLQDTRLNLQPQFYGFLNTAAQPLINGGSTTDSYPPCLG